MSYLILSYHINDLGAEALARYNYQEEDLESFLRYIQQELEFDEVLYLATCNRVEFLFHTQDIEQIFSSLASVKGLELNGARIFSEQTSVVHHLLEVALSLDSVVFGENQILGQLKTAYLESLKKGFCGAQITKLIQNILKHSKQIRSKRHLSTIHNSVASIAAKHFTENFYSSSPLLLVGAGESNQLFARYMAKRSYKNITWCNRTEERAKEAQRSIGGDLLSWQDFNIGKLPNSDALVLTTSAGKEILSEEALEASGAKIVYDLSIPANASKVMVTRLGVTYVGMEELKEELAKEEERYRELKAQLKADLLEAVESIDKLLLEKVYDPVIAESLQSIDQILTKAMSDLPRELKNLDSMQLEALKLWTHNLIKKTKHEHITTIKSISPLKKTK